MNRDVIKVVTILLSITIILSSLAYVYTAERQQFLQGEASYSLSYHYYVENQGPLNLSSLGIRLAVLKTWEPVQRVTHIAISPEPNRTTIDEYENQFIYYDFDTFVVGQSLNVSIQADLVVNILDYTGIDFTGKTYDINSDQYRLFSSYDSLTDPTDPKILQVAQNLPGDIKNPVNREFSAYNYTVSHLKYRLLSTSRGASFALSQGYGDCDEFQNLFIALSHAQGVPAVGHTAWFADFIEGQTYTDQGAIAHAYPMFLAPGEGLLPVDPTRGATSIFDNWLKTDYKRITLTRGPDHPYRLLNYRWVPDAILGDPVVASNYTIFIKNLSIDYFSKVRQIILDTLVGIPIVFAVYNIVIAIKGKALRDKKLDMLLSPTYHDNEMDF